MTSVPPLTSVVNKTGVSATEAVEDALNLMRALHEPVPCVLCDPNGRHYDTLTPTPADTEGDTCPACHGTRRIYPAVTCSASLENIAVLEALLAELKKGAKS